MSNKVNPTRSEWWDAVLGPLAPAEVLAQLGGDGDIAHHVGGMLFDAVVGAPEWPWSNAEDTAFTAWAVKRLELAREGTTPFDGLVAAIEADMGALWDDGGDLLFRTDGSADDEAKLTTVRRMIADARTLVGRSDREE